MGIEPTLSVLSTCVGTSQHYTPYTSSLTYFREFVNPPSLNPRYAGDVWEGTSPIVGAIHRTNTQASVLHSPRDLVRRTTMVNHPNSFDLLHILKVWPTFNLTFQWCFPIIPKDRFDVWDNVSKRFVEKRVNLL